VKTVLFSCNPGGYDRGHIGEHRFPRVATVSSNIKGSLTPLSGIETKTARSVSHAGKNRFCIGGMGH